MKTFLASYLIPQARAIVKLCLIGPLLVGIHVFGQSATPTSEEMARLRADRDALESKLAAAQTRIEQAERALAALAQENEVLKKSSQSESSDARKAKVVVAPMVAPASESSTSAAAPRAPANIPVTTTSASPAAGDKSVVMLEAFAVTGSNIKRFDQEKILPVTIFNADAMQLRNALTPTDMLMALPQVTALADVESHSASAGPRGDNANISLRNLGSSAALILVNGRRVAPQPMAGNLAVNVNQLPNQGISQIEVLRDGASAIYGSDAIAGVINYVMRTDYRGTNLKTRFSSPESIGWNGQSVEATLTMGRDFAGGRGRFLTTIDAFYREAIFLKDTKFNTANHTALAPAPFNIPGSAFDSTAAIGQWPTFRVGTSAVTNYFYLRSGVPTLTTIAPTRAANPDEFYNSNQDLMGSPRTRRENIFNRVEYDLTPRLTAFADVSFYKADSTTTRQPISMNAPTSDLPAPMALDNPFNPYGSRFFSPTGAPNADGTPRLTGTPQQTIMYSGMIKNLPPDRINVSAGSYRFVTGLKGKLTDTWNWEVADVYSQYYSSDNAPNSVRESLYQAALLRNGVSPQADPRFAAEAGAMNPFGYTFKVANGAVVADQVYKNPKSVMDTFVDPSWRQDGRSFLGSVDARASGRLFNLWAGAVNLSVGGEYRKESFRWVRPFNESTRNDFYVSSPIPDNSGSRSVLSFYGETVVPLVAAKNEIPLVNTFEVSGSARYERYSDFGSTLRPKAGANWRPFSNLMLRGSYNNGFSAPSLQDLYSPPSSTIGSAASQIDTYRNVATREGPYVTLSVTSGNANLKPVKSTGKTAGIVLDVPYLKGLTLTADYYQISQHDNVGSRGANTIYISDDTLLRAYVAQQRAAGVPIMSIDTGSGTANYKGDPGLQRFAPDVNDVAVFTAYNAANPNAPIAVVGKVRAVNSPTQNLASAYVSGWDYGLQYTFPTNRFGRFSFNADANQLVRSISVNAPPNTTPVVTVSKDANGGNAIVWRGNAGLSWRKGKWTSGVSAYYLGNWSNASTTQALYVAAGSPSYIRREFDGGAFVYRYVVDAVMTYNGFVAYNFGPERSAFWKPSTIKLSATNLSDKMPPLSTGVFGYDETKYGNLMAGRSWTLEVTKDF